MLSKMLKVTNQLILEGSCGMLIVGGAMLVMANLYRFGKELGHDVYKIKAAKAYKREAERMKKNG